MTTDRLSINTLTSEQLETLLRERQQARASLAGTAARLRQVSAERDRLRAERDQLTAALAEVLATFWAVREPSGGVIGAQSSVVRPDDFARWRAVLDATPEAAAVPQPPGCDTGRHIHHPGLTCEQADAQIAAERAYRDAEWLARRLNGDAP